MKKVKERPYVPRYGSGPYALLIGLFRARDEDGQEYFLTKEQLIAYATPLSEKSFTVPDPGKFYTAWSSMKTLQERGLVVKAKSK